MLRISVIVAVVILLAAALAWTLGNARFRTRMIEARTAWSRLAAPSGPAFDPAALVREPEIARRYLTHAIAPGTLLQPTVTLTMEGAFRLGDAANPREMRMTARQRLAAPGAFVWIARMRGRGMTIDGSDGFDGHDGWTRFWLFRALPLVQQDGGEDLNRSAAARPALEAVWAPAALHPAFGARWVQTGPDSADVTFTGGAEPFTISLTLSPSGAVETVSARRWSNANPEKVFRWQSFGARARTEATFGGYTIPSEMEAGNHFGTPEWFAFFDATITAADYSAG